MNNLSNDFLTNLKPFADEIYLFSVFHNIRISTNNLKEDLKKIKDWVSQWKTSSNPNSTKQLQEIIFSRKKAMCFNDMYEKKNSPSSI